MPNKCARGTWQPSQATSWPVCGTSSGRWARTIDRSRSWLPTLPIAPASFVRSTTVPSPLGGWPKLSADAELRHLAWPVVRDALNALNKSDEDDGLKLELRWDQGLLLSISPSTEVIAVRQILLVEHIADHHLQVSRIGGWLRTPTEGPPRLEVFLPCAGPEQPAKPDPERSRHIVVAGLMVIACSASLQR